MQGCQDGKVKQPLKCVQHYAWHMVVTWSSYVQNNSTLLDFRLLANSTHSQSSGTAKAREQLLLEPRFQRLAVSPPLLSTGISGFQEVHKHQQ